MTTRIVKVVASAKQIEDAFHRDSVIEGYKRISGDSRRGTYLVDVREGRKAWIAGKAVG